MDHPYTLLIVNGHINSPTCNIENDTLILSNIIKKYNLPVELKTIYAGYRNCDYNEEYGNLNFIPHFWPISILLHNDTLIKLKQKLPITRKEINIFPLNVLVDGYALKIGENYKICKEGDGFYYQSNLHLKDTELCVYKGITMTGPCNHYNTIKPRNLDGYLSWFQEFKFLKEKLV